MGLKVAKGTVSEYSLARDEIRACLHGQELSGRGRVAEFVDDGREEEADSVERADDAPVH